MILMGVGQHDAPDGFALEDGGVGHDHIDTGRRQVAEGHTHIDAQPLAGRLGAVDASLINDGRLFRLEDPADIALVRRERSATPPMRDPDVLVDLILGAAAPRGSGRRRRSPTIRML
jgi:hypothetical protein